jgi:hypothetical protein
MEQGSISSNSRDWLWRCMSCLGASLLMLGFLPAPTLSGQEAASTDTLTYTKVMKGSMPEYTSLIVDSNGDGTYDGRQLNEPPKPRTLRLSPETTATLFQMAAALGDFHSLKLESNKNVANLGLKTFVYRHDGQENTLQFNYTRNKRAQELLSVFEGVADVEQHIGTLEYSSRYDLLGLPSALTRIEIDLDNRELVDPQLMVPILKKIAGDSQYLHIAQVRAADILRRIQDDYSPNKAERR